MNSKSDDISPIKPISNYNEQQTSLNPASSFQSYMEAKNPSSNTSASGISPFDLAQGKSLTNGPPTINNLIDQTKQAHNALGDVTQQLQNKNLKLSRSQQQIIRSKITTASSYLETVNSNLGIPVIKTSAPSSTGILGKFLNYVKDGQANLEAAEKHLSTLTKDGNQMDPGKFIAIQTKLMLAQQNIEYTSIILSKATDTIKGLMNTQI